jgi:AcrR family transcriptional regulator
MRELARELDLSPGNLSYHFATKDDLVVALVRQGHAANNALVSQPAIEGFGDVDGLIRAFMRRDLENPWLMRDYPALLIAIPELRKMHEGMQAAREARVDALIARLADCGLLNRERVHRGQARLRRQIFTQVFFWLPSAIVSAPAEEPAKSLDAHARAALALFLPFCTPAGHKQLVPLTE